MTDVYLIHLSGQGDVDIALVDKVTFEWVTSRDKGQRPEDVGKSGWIDQSVPESVRERLPKGEREVHLSSGSFENDRALVATTLRGVKTFTSVRGAMAYVRHENLNIVDEYEGYIY